VESSGKLDLKFSTDQKTFTRLQRTRLGKRIMCTDNDDWSADRIILGCRAQHLVETAIRQMKNPHWVSFSPCFHWIDQKLRAHAFYCVLALLLTSLLMREAARAGIEMSVPALR
jgi:transposase